jgi:hypothetical protein
MCESQSCDSEVPAISLALFIEHDSASSSSKLGQDEPHGFLKNEVSVVEKMGNHDSSKAPNQFLVVDKTPRKAFIPCVKSSVKVFVITPPIQVINTFVYKFMNQVAPLKHIVRTIIYYLHVLGT